MAYTSSAAIESAIGSSDLAALSDVDGGDAPSIIAAAIAEADTLIDSYAHKRHRVPLAVVPQVIASLSLRMAIRIMRRNRRMVLASDVEDEKNDRRWLEDLSKGLVTIAVDPLPAGSEDLAVDKYGQREPLREVSRKRSRGLW